MKKLIPAIAGAVLVVALALIYLNWQRSRMNPTVSNSTRTPIV